MEHKVGLVEVKAAQERHWYSYGYGRNVTVGNRLEDVEYKPGDLLNTF